MGEESENKQVNAFEYDKALRDYFSEVGSDIWVEREQLLDRIRSYPESFERDKVLVEQPGKRWDMSKSLPDDISYRREKWGLERAIEGARMSYDWFKHLPVVSTGSVLLITAVTKALFPKPSVAWLLVLALSAFMVSALASVFLMAGSAAAATATLAVDEPRRGLWKLWTALQSERIQLGLLYFGLLSFVTGMLTFTAFAAWNVI